MDKKLFDQLTESAEHFVPGRPIPAPVDAFDMRPPSLDHPDRPVTPPKVSEPWVGKRRGKARRKR